MKPWTTHFAILDAYRGIAAVTVLLFHVAAPLHISWLAPNAYLAVDFFFLLSGFVVDRAYGRRLTDPLYKTKFLMLRVARLWPMILLGTLLGCIVSLVHFGSSHSLAAGQSVSALVFGLLLLPLGTLPSTGFIFPFDGPLWSLFYEAVANIAYCFAFNMLRNKLLVAIAFASGLGLMYVGFLKGHLEVGAGGTYIEYAGGISRVTFSFFMGVLISRNVHRFSHLWLPTKILIILLIVALMSPLPHRHPLFDVICALAVFPILILAGLRNSIPSACLPVCALLGELSYPLYAIHYPIIRVFLHVQETRGLSGLELGLSVTLEIIVCILAAYTAMLLVDRPLRARFTRFVKQISGEGRSLEVNARKL
jgi:peptidoglycan/LPS O-acetylase OafA/YrhL